MARFWIFILVVLSCGSAWAVDRYSETATKQTQELLRNKAKRKEAVKTGDAKKIDEYISKLAHDDPKIIQKIYELAADIFPATVEDGSGDPTKMKKLTQDYKGNPEDFINNMTPEQKRKLHELSIMLTPVKRD